MPRSNLPMNQCQCTVEGCTKPARARWMCQAHYKLWQKKDMVGRERYPWGKRDVLDRLADKFTVNDGCWLWIGGLSQKGYGSFSSRRSEGGSCHAHRTVYELLVGPVPDGLELDHLCRVHRCVRPSHLEPVTHRENMARSLTAPWMKMRARTHCPKGHLLPTEPDKTGRRPCSVCKQIRRRKRYEQTGA